LENTNTVETTENSRNPNKSNMKTALIPLVRDLGLNKTDFILNMFNNYESIAEANKTLNMNMNGSTTCLIYQEY